MNGKVPSNRFAGFNPEEKAILMHLLGEHANTVSQIAVATDVRVAAYLMKIESLENEIKMIYAGA